MELTNSEIQSLTYWAAVADAEITTKQSRARAKHSAGEAKASDRRKRQGFGWPKSHLRVAFSNRVRKDI